jgi:YesN/AraC family two-component response regulator
MKVLIVDDDPDVCTFLMNCMDTMECEQIDSAESGEEALAKAVQDRYDLVTLDIKMPGVSGLDILSVIRGMMPASVIAIISGYTEDLPEGVDEHADLVISKPVRVSTLQRLVDLSKALAETRDEVRAIRDEVIDEDEA